MLDGVFPHGPEQRPPITQRPGTTLEGGGDGVASGAEGDEPGRGKGLRDSGVGGFRRRAENSRAVVVNVRAGLVISAMKEDFVQVSHVEHLAALFAPDEVLFVCF
jgi:hypothetical protein